jgi:hypothetical protein
VVQPEGVKLGVVDLAHNGGLVDVVASSGFLGILFKMLARKTVLPPYVIRSH